MNLCRERALQAGTLEYVGQYCCHALLEHCVSCCPHTQLPWSTWCCQNRCDPSRCTTSAPSPHGATPGPQGGRRGKAQWRTPQGVTEPQGETWVSCGLSETSGISQLLRSHPDLIYHTPLWYQLNIEGNNWDHIKETLPVLRASCRNVGHYRERELIDLTATNVTKSSDVGEHLEVNWAITLLQEKTEQWLRKIYYSYSFALVLIQDSPGF